MTPEVRDRIEQIRRGNVPEGYTKTVFGCIPIQWKTTKCRDVLKDATLGGNYEPCERGSLPLIKMGNIGRGSMDCRKAEYLKNEAEADEKDLLKYGDILFNTRNTMELVGKVAIWRNELPVAYFNSNIMRLSFFPKLISTNEYANYLFNLGTVLSQLRRLATGTTSVAAIYRRDLDIVHLALPPLDEQQKIAEILTAQDKVIELKEKLLAEKQRQKKYLMQQLLTGKRRLPGFNEEWRFIRARTIFENITDKKHDGTLEVLSVTQDRGIIPRSQVDIDIKYTNKSLSGYKKVVKGNFVISLRSFQGGIEYSEYEGIVSPAYIVLSASYPIDNGYYKQFFKSPDYISRLSVAVYGIRDGKQISYEDFGRIKIPYPPLNEQKTIAKVLTTADHEIDLLQQDLEQEKQKKKALMQLLLTGIVRV